MNETQNKFDKVFAIYKPSRAGGGSAVQFDFNLQKKSVFVEAAKQKGSEQSFDWQNKLAFKLSVTDMAKLLTVLHGKLPSTELFHDPGKGSYASAAEVKNSALSIAKAQRGFYFKLSTQMKAGTVTAINLSIAEDEAIVFGLLLEEAVRKSYGW
jgi:hypothetical protein